MTYRRKVDVNPFNSISSILFLVLAFVALYFVATWVFKILAYAAPVMLLGALIINHKVVLNYGKWLVNLLKKNPLMGVGGVLLTFFGFPIIAGFLLGKALLFRKVDKLKKEFEGGQTQSGSQTEFTDYEEVDDEPQVRLELPEFEKPRVNPKKDKNSDYEQFFD